MVSLPGDVAPERFHGFYDQTAPARDLYRLQAQDIPQRDFLERQSGIHAGIPNARAKLRDINGFMHASTSYHAVQNAPHYMRSRWQHVAERNREIAARDLAKHHEAVHNLRQEHKHYLETRAKKHPEEILRSAASGLKLKQAMRQVLHKGKYVMKRETVTSTRKRGKFEGPNGAPYGLPDTEQLLRKIAKVGPGIDEENLIELAEVDKKLQERLARDKKLTIEEARRLENLAREI